MHHRDPFDRMLVAQAQAEGLTIVTADAALRRIPFDFDRFRFQRVQMRSDGLLRLTRPSR